MVRVLYNKKQTITAPKVASMAKEGKKDVKDALKAKYTFSKIYDYVVHKAYPSHVYKLYKHGLRKRSKFFTADRGCLVLYYIGRKGSEKPCLVVESVEERRIISSIHDQAHLGQTWQR